ncbi:meiotic recombination protein REC8 homolog [Varanus komodoensis]|uniref:meiotic recombination protein REC8 homolog n=1 Tax=Varanus komodoensis TaxID=61221 RepID=UPI001CF77591|nr:meiotic recombination protein REC8 homolog [Varanus komodoensis]
MFYYPNVLQRHTGCFATIWLAATGATKLLKREYLKVNIPQTCEEIMAFILVRVPPPVPGAPRPRFSLYLSAQLQYGVIRVYSRQCQYLVEDIQQILERLHRAQLQIRIDLTDLEQPGLLLPDQLVLMEALEEAPNPFFGVMEPVLPSPASIPHIRHLLEAPTPERSPVERSPPPPVPRRRAEEPLLTLPPEAITLKEMEPIIVLPIEGEKDLPEITVKEIEMLVEQEGFVAPGEERPLRVSPRKRRAEEEPAEEVREEEALVSVGLLSPTWIGEEPSAIQETGLLLPEETRLLEEVPRPPLEVTPDREGLRLQPSPPVSAVLEERAPWSPEVKGEEGTRGQPNSSLAAPQLHLPEYEPSPPGPPKRRRQLRFLDPVTQLSREDFQSQLLDPQAQCQRLETVLLPGKRLRTPAELLGGPTYGWMHPTLLGLWSRCASLQRVDYARRRVLEEEEIERAVEEVQKAEVPSELEELRAAEEGSVSRVGSSEISLEITEEELRPSLVAVEERIPLEPEEVALPVVPELPEISFELPLEKDAVTLDSVRRCAHPGEFPILGPGVPNLFQPEVCSVSSFGRTLEWLHSLVGGSRPQYKKTAARVVLKLLFPVQNLWRMISELVAAKLQEFGEMRLDTLVPLSTSRAVASRVFYLCLVLSGAQYLSLEQAEPYGAIVIKPGARFHVS